MRKHVCALAVAVVLAGCSSSSDDDTSAVDNTPTDTPASDPDATPGTDVPAGPPVDAPVGDTKAGTWIGDIGYGEGVYVVDGSNRLSGMALAADGSAQSTFGDLGTGDSFAGTLDDHGHPASAGGAGNAFAPQGDPVETPVDYQLNIVNGQTIESLDPAQPFTLTFATDGALTPATPDSLAGDWLGIHTFGTADALTAFDMALSFAGTDVSGSTGLDNPEFPFEHTITGNIQAFGAVSTITFDWVDDVDGTVRTYAGAVFFAPDGSGDLIVNTDYVSGEGDPQTLSSRLVRQ